MTTEIHIEVTRIEYNRLLPLITDIDGLKIESPVLNELDAVGIIRVKGVDGDKIIIRVCYGRE